MSTRAGQREERMRLFGRRRRRELRGAMAPTADLAAGDFSRLHCAGESS